MKKLYFLAATLLAATSIYAQEFSASAGTALSVGTTNNRPADILFSQEQTATNGIVSDILADGNFVISSDDFILTQNSNISTISILGFQTNANLNTVVTGIELYVFADGGGIPNGIPGDGTEVFKVVLPSTSTAYTMTNPSGNYYLFTVDVAAALGTAPVLDGDTHYWLAFAPKTNLTAYTNAARWNWIVGDVNDSPAVLVDPSNAFGAGATNWTELNLLTGNAVFDGLAFTIEGTSALGVSNVSTIKDVIATYDKATDSVHIFVNNKKFQNAEVYSADGRKVLASNNSVFNTSSLKSGVYIVKVQAQDGTVKSTKFIK